MKTRIYLFLLLLTLINGTSFAQLPGGLGISLNPAPGIGCNTTGSIANCNEFIRNQRCPIHISAVTHNPRCNGGSHGNIITTVTGGGAPYFYFWSNGSHRRDLFGVPAGTYYLLVIDIHGCFASASYTITEPSPIALSAHIRDVACHGGIGGHINVDATGGTPWYLYDWDTHGSGFAWFDNFYGPAGTYGVTVIDGHGCRAHADYTITQPDPVSVKVASTTNVSCNGGNDGSINTIATGGTAPYHYFWSNGAHTSNISGLTAGTYYLSIVDAHGCIGTASYTITEPSAIVLTGHVHDVLCNGGFGGRINVEASGGTPWYAYSWATHGTGFGWYNNLFGAAGTYEVTVTDGHGCHATGAYTIGQPSAIDLTAVTTNVSCHGGDNGKINTTVTGGTSPYHYHWSNGAHTADLSGLSAGTYHLVVVDAHGCNTHHSYTITEPSALTLSATTTAVRCNGGHDGSINAVVSGGTPGYTYSWGHGCHTADPSELSAGTYTLTVTDANGCHVSGTYTVTEPDAISISGVTRNVACHGGDHGAINTTVTGGTGGYSYSWSNGCHAADPTGLSAGTYHLIVTDAHGCHGSASYTVTEPARLTITATTENVSCHGGHNGHIHPVVTGGTPGYRYLWAHGCHTMDPSDLSAGTYVLTVIDAHGCIASATYTITEPTPLGITGTVSGVTCHGGDNGHINTTVRGGTPVYAYAWSNGCHAADPSGLSAGTYHVVVTDANGCHTGAAYTVTEPSAIHISAVVTNVMGCHGGDHGRINTTVTGGTGGYSYSWSNGCHSADPSGLTAGTYHLTVTDARGCSATGSYTVTEPSAISITATTGNVACHGGNHGHINTTVTGGTPGYRYAWSNGCHTADPSGLTAGTYHLVVTDAHGCHATASYTITEPAALSITASVANVNCHGGHDGHVYAHVTGGTPGYTYSWSHGCHTTDPSDLAAGTYHLTVTDAHGCVATATYTITEPSVISIAGTTANVTCNGGNNGHIHAIASGGTPGYTYSWSHGCHTADPSELTAGTYHLTVTDAHGCTASATYTITEPSAIAIHGTVTNVACHGGNHGSIHTSVSGGTAGYAYSWSNGCHTANPSGLTAGTYHVTVTDAHGCHASASYTVTEPSAITVSGTVTNVSCHGSRNGHIGVTASGGTPGYTYSWSHGCHTALPSDLAPGTYNVTVTDAHGCIATASYTVTEPAPLSISATTGNVSCHGGNNGHIRAIASGGTPGYTYSWSHGCHTADPSELTAGTYHLTVTDAHGCTASATYTITEPSAIHIAATVVNVRGCHGANNGHINTTVTGGTGGYAYSWSNGCHAADPSGLSAGTYNLTVTDAHGCTATGSYTVTEPAAIVISATTGNVSCHGGRNGYINTSVSGGRPGYTYLWSNGCRAADPLGLAAGTYHVTVTDQHGCTATASYTITEPSAISISATTCNVACNGGHNGHINAAATGGTPGYTYSWSHGCHTADPTDLAAGVYHLTVTDAHGCTATASYTITEPSAISITATTGNVSCHGGNNGHIHATATGGTPGYTYSWGHGCHTADPSELSAGTYNLTVTDAHGCTATATYTITEPSAIHIAATVVDVRGCHGDHNGRINTTVTGGTCGYTYSWSNGCHAANPTGLAAGTYNLTVTDAHGCTATGSYTVTEPAAISISGTVCNVTCHGDHNGHINTTVTGGRPGYLYCWSNGSHAADPSGLCAGTYHVTVTDVHGCHATASYTITEPAAIHISATVTNVGCHGGRDGHIQAEVSGGTPAYTYSWSTGCHTVDPSGLAAGTYHLTVTDAHGCTATATYTITEPSAIHIAAATANVTGCHGSSNGRINTTVTGGTAPYSYSWSNGCHAADPTGLAAGTYHLTVTDAHGCSATGTYIITEPAAIVISGTVHNVTCHGDHNGSINTTVGGGCAHYTYAWSNGCHAADPTGLSAGTYHLTVTDAHGCTATASYTVTEPAPIHITATTANVSCHGGHNGHISAVACGGTPGYTYLWSHGCHTADPSDLAAGTYHLTVTDAHGCSATETYTITEPAAIALSATITNVSCHGGHNGSINVTATGGTPGYTYSWGHGCHTTDPSELSAGTYNVTVTDAHGCSATATYIVTEPAEMAIAAHITPVSCHGGFDGHIDVDVTGGTPGYTYAWPFISDAEYGYGDDFHGRVGTITVTVTDAHGCTATGAYTITEPAAITITGTVTSEGCHSGGHGGSINTTVTGGTGAYTYSWSNGCHAADPTGLSAGIYYLTVTDAHGCTGRATFTVAPSAAIHLAGTVSNVSCHGGDNGRIDVLATGGTPCYTYVWSHGCHTTDPSELSAGTYHVTVTDAHGCSADASYTVTEPDAIHVCASVSNATCRGCNNGRINTTVTGGTPCYSYSWSNGAHTADLCGLSAGVYCLTVTDAKDCSAHGSYTVEEPHGDGPCGKAAPASGNVGETVTADAIKVYPNPTSGNFSVVIPTIHKDAVITITDVTGKVIDQRFVTDNSGEAYKFTLTNMASGMYMVKVQSGETTYTEKLMLK